jgi:hypothetical protein
VYGGCAFYIICVPDDLQSLKKLLAERKHSLVIFNLSPEFFLNSKLKIQEHENALHLSLIGMVLKCLNFSILPRLGTSSSTRPLYNTQMFN